MRIDGKPTRPKKCIKCGESLPRSPQYSGRATVQWYVREFDPNTGKTHDTNCPSSEAADELIRQRQRDWTPDPIQRSLMEHASVLIRQIHADTRDDAVIALIEKLGGDATIRSIKPIEWNDAVETIADEMRQKGHSECYIADMMRVLGDLAIITGATRLPEIDLDAVAKYRSVRMKGGWTRDQRKVKAIGGRAINKDFGTLSAFIQRALKKGWMAHNPLRNAPDERVKVKAVRVAYMPDEDLAAIIEKADGSWMQALIIVAYYTGARRGDLLRLEWESDIDLDGKCAEAEGRCGPQIYIKGNKADTAHWMALHPAAVTTLEDLRKQPVIDRCVFPVRESARPGSWVSRRFAEICVKAGLTTTKVLNGKQKEKNRWKLHDLRRKANTDLRNRGASNKERAALLGHRTTAVNEMHYEAMIPSRERELIDGLPVFGKVG
jgi:integrase